MNNFLQQQKCFITTLAPVHMGAGEDYYPTQYVMDDGSLYVFDEIQMSKALGSSMMMELAKLAESPKDAMSALQKKVFEQRDKLKLVAEQIIPVSSGIQSKYTSTLNGGRNELAIQRTFYNPFNNSPVITGSGIKGAIRTALLDQLNNERNNPTLIGDKARGPVKGAAEQLQKQLLAYNKVDEDPLRILKVSDAPFHHPDKLQSTEVLYAVRRKREPKPDRKPNSITSMLECISPWRSRSFSFDLSLLDRSIAEKSGKSFNIPENIDGFVAACNRYYLDKLTKDLTFLDRQGYSQNKQAEATWSKKLCRLLSGELGEAIKFNKVMLLRLGKHGGAEDKTLNGMRAIKIMLGKGNGSEYRSRTTEVGLAASDVSDTQNLMPFGWVLVELGEQNLPETMSFIREMAEPAYARLQKDAAHAAEREKTLAEQQAKEKAEREKREAEEKAAAEKAAALAAMSDGMREIQSLLDRMAKGEDKSKGAGCQLAGSVGKTLEAGVQWPATDKQFLLEAAPRLLAHLGIDPKNDKWKKRINALKT